MTVRARTAALFGVVLLGCTKVAPPAPPPPPSVGVATPTRRTVTLYAENVGTTRASESVEVRARVSGELESMEFQPSRPVTEGELLFVIEPLPYRAAYDAAVAAVASAEAQLERTEADLARVQEAVKTDAVSKAQVDLAQADRDVAAAAVLTAEAELEQAKLQLSYTEVRSPIEGQVGRNLVDVGNVVGPETTPVLTTVNRMKPLFVYYQAPEVAVLEALRKRDVTHESYHDDPTHGFVGTLVDDGFPFKGTIDYVSNTVDASTGTIELRLVIPNEDLQLFPGLFVRVRTPIGELTDAVLVEERAIGTDLGGRYVYLVGGDNVVEQRYVETGPVQDDGKIPITAGLQGTETYIVEGLLRARPGLPVTPGPIQAADAED